MITFQNPFLSIAGQKERLSNAFETVKASVTSGFAFKAAAAIAVVANPTAALGVAKQAGSIAVKEFSKLSAVGKIATVASTPVVVGALASSEKARTAIVNAPSASYDFGKQIGSLIEDPSLNKASTLLKEHPVASVLTAGAGLAAVGVVGRGVVSTIATMSNTQALKEVKTSLQQPSVGLPTLPSSSASLPSMPEAELSRTPSLTPEPSMAPSAQLVTTKQKSSSVSTSRRKPKRYALKTQNLNILYNKISNYGN